MNTKQKILLIITLATLLAAAAFGKPKEKNFPLHVIVTSSVNRVEGSGNYVLPSCAGGICSGGGELLMNVLYIRVRIEPQQFNGKDTVYLQEFDGQVNADNGFKGVVGLQEHPIPEGQYPARIMQLFNKSWVIQLLGKNSKGKPHVWTYFVTHNRITIPRPKSCEETLGVGWVLEYIGNTDSICTQK